MSDETVVNGAHVRASDATQIRISSFLVSVAAFCVFIYCDLKWSQLGADIIPILAIGILGTVWAGPLTLFAGTRRYQTFKWWQPFEGGLVFLCTQAFGWTLYAASLLGAAIVAVNARARHTAGAYTMVGLISFAAQVLLNVSITHFKETVEGSDSDTDTQSAVARVVGSARWRSSWLLLNGKTVVSLLLSGWGLGVFAFCDMSRGSFSQNDATPIILIRVAALAYAVAAAITHLLNGCGEVPGWRAWMPFEGGHVFTTLQAFAWALLATTLQVVLSLPTDLRDVSMDGALIGVGTMGFISQVVLVASLKKFKRTPALRSGAALRALRAPEGTALVGEVQLAAALPVICSIMLGSLWLARQGMLEELCGVKMDYLEAATILVAFGAAPMAHAGGRRMFPQQYSLWRPFEGGSAFVALQGFGWMFYAISLCIVVLVLRNCLPMSLTKLFPAVVFPQLLIIASLRYYNRRKQTRVHVAGWSSESIASCALAVLGCVLAGAAQPLYEHLSVPVALVVTGSMLSTCSAAVVNHAGGMRRFSTFAVWQPFQGGGAFMLRQTVGWVVCGFSLLAQIVMLVTDAEHFAADGVYAVTGITALAGQAVLIKSVGHFVEKPTGPAANKPRPPRRRERLLYGLLALLAFAIFAGAEWARLAGHDSVASVLMCMGAALTCLQGLVVHVVVGPRQSPRWRLFQPFRGGLPFCILQALGWIFFAFVMIATQTCLFVGLKELTMNGVQVAIGCIAFTAQAVLWISTSVFAPDEHEEEAIGEVFRHYSHTRSFATLISVSALAILVCVDAALLQYGPHVPILPLLLCTAVALFGAFPLTLWFGPKAGRFLQAPSGSEYSMVHLMAWTVWSFTVLLGCLLCHSVWSAGPAFELGASEEVAAGVIGSGRPWGTLTGLAGLIAQLLVLYRDSDGDGKLLNSVFARYPLAVAWRSLAVVAFACGYYIILPALRVFLDYPMFYYAKIWRHLPGRYAQDGRQIMEGIRAADGVRYGSHKLETIDILFPEKVDEERDPVIYVHGGGFVAVNSMTVLHSLTPIARMGCPVYSINYPLAPEDRFPTSLVSVLRAVVWVGRHTKRNSVQLFGDSAGGNLVTMAAALLSNRSLMEEFAQLTSEPVLEWRYPKVSHVVSLYGVVDQTSWRGTPMASVLGFCMRCYAPETPLFRGRYTLGDLSPEDLADYPDTLLVTASADPLHYSNEAIHRTLVAAGRPCKLIKYPGMHGFLGFPIQWTFGKWRDNCLPATEICGSFLLNRDLTYPHFEAPWDWTGIILAPWIVALIYVLSRVARPC